MAQQQVDLRQFSTLIDRTAALVPNLTYEQPLKLCAIALAADTKKNFEGSHTPDGQPWLPIKPRRRKRDKIAWLKRQKKGLAKLPDKPLVDTGLLMASVSAADATQQGAIRDITHARLVFGSSIEYGEYHQRENRAGLNFPRREWLGINTQTANTMSKIVEEFVANKVVEALGGRS
jgi:phage gpG-like protein